MNKIDLSFNVVKFEDVFEFFADFLEDFSKPISKDLLSMLKIDFAVFQTLNKKEQKAEIKKKTKDSYNQNLSKMQNCLPKFEKFWEDSKQKIEAGFKTIFGGFEDQKCLAAATFNCRVFPRYLEEKSFDFYFDFNKNLFLQNAIHEITHFIWFDKLKKLMPTINKTEYEAPSAVWLFSEIAVDMVFENTPFFKIISKKTRRHPAYNYFYTDKIGNETIIEHFRALFKNCKTMDEFIVCGTKESLELFK